jgi:hypothetical protein
MYAIWMALTLLVFALSTASLGSADPAPLSADRELDQVEISKSVNTGLWVALGVLERISPETCAVLILEGSRFNPTFEQLLPAVLPFIKSNSPKVRFAVASFAGSSRKAEAICPVFEMLKTEDCMYVVYASLEVFFRTQDKDLLLPGVKILLGKPMTLPDLVPDKKCTNRDERNYWHGDAPIDFYLRDRIVLALSSIGPKAFHLLVQSLQAPKSSEDVRIACAAAIREIVHVAWAAKDRDTLRVAEALKPALINELDARHEEWVQRALVTAIERIALSQGKSAPELERVSQDKNRTKMVREWAKMAVKRIEESKNK